MPLSARNVTRVRSTESAAIAGVVYAVLTLISLILLNRTPSPAIGDAELMAWYDVSANRTSATSALTLASISAIAFLWFVAVIRRRIGDREDRFFATVFLGAAIVYVAVWLVAAAAIAAPAVAVTLLDATPDSSVMTFAYGHGAALVLVVLPRLQAVFVMASTTIVRRTGALERWVTIFGYVVAAVLLVTPIVARSIGVAFPIWVLVVSVALLIAPSRDARA